jgi:hypothetical protein
MAFSEFSHLFNESPGLLFPHVADPDHIRCFARTSPPTCYSEFGRWGRVPTTRSRRGVDVNRNKK